MELPEKSVTMPIESSPTLRPLVARSSFGSEGTNMGGHVRITWCGWGDRASPIYPIVFRPHCLSLGLDLRPCLLLVTLNHRPYRPASHYLKSPRSSLEYQARTGLLYPQKLHPPLDIFYRTPLRSQPHSALPPPHPYNVSTRVYRVPPRVPQLRIPRIHHIRRVRPLQRTRRRHDDLRRPPLKRRPGPTFGLL